MGNELRYIYDDFEVKQGLYSPGHHIPVLPSQEIYNRRPDYIVVIHGDITKKLFLNIKIL